MGCGSLSKAWPSSDEQDQGSDLKNHGVGRVSPIPGGAQQRNLGDVEGVLSRDKRERRKSAEVGPRPVKQTERERKTDVTREVPRGGKDEEEDEQGVEEGRADEREADRRMDGIGNSAGLGRLMSSKNGGPQRSVRDHYKFWRTLGKGSYATVKLATSKETGEEFAIKILPVPTFFRRKGTSREGIFKEIDLLMRIDHANVVSLHDFFDEGNKVYLVMEYLRGGDLISTLLKKGTYTEDDARQCFRQIMEGLQYLHSHKIVHRDLKLENVLLAEKGDLSCVKIADFGFAKQVSSKNLLSTVCGTPLYVAPEVIGGGKYTSAIDMWSAGIMLYILLGGHPPFYSENEPELFNLICCGTYTFYDPVWKNVSKPAKQLIQKLLVVQPSKRPAALDVLHHRWLSQDKTKNATDGMEDNDLSATMARFRRHIALHKVRSAVKAIVWLNRLSNAVQAGAKAEEEERAKGSLAVGTLRRISSFPARLNIAGSQSELASDSNSSKMSMERAPLLSKTSERDKRPTTIQEDYMELRTSSIKGASSIRGTTSGTLDSPFGTPLLPDLPCLEPMDDRQLLEDVETRGQEDGMKDKAKQKEDRVVQNGGHMHVGEEEADNELPNNLEL